MKKIVFFLGVLTIAFSCNNTGKLTYTEKRLLGSWFFTNVDFAPRWGFKKDITKDHFGEKLTFLSDFTMFYEDTEAGTNYDGVWQVNETTNIDSDGSSTPSYQLFASYENPLTGSITQLVWDNINVGKNRICARNETQDGFYTYELKRF